MAKDLSELQHNKVSVVDVVHFGEKITLPENMSAEDAIVALERHATYMQQTVEISSNFDAFPWDGANALALAIERRFGFAVAQATPSFFGSEPPKMINIEVGPGQNKRVPWGRFSLPGMKGYVETGVSQNRGRYVFAIRANVLRNDEDTINALFADVKKILENESIYAGKAIKIRFRDDSGKVLSMPEPQFMSVDHINREQLIYSKEIAEAIETNLFTPIERVQDCEANDIPFKRGVLLGGPYGTGKTLAATVASRIAQDNNVTYVYVPRADELADAIEFAKQYQTTAAVVFCEDIDRTVNGERSIAMDDILNILDGIDTKSSRILTILTTNHLQNINPAMLRPGRLDAIINVTAPDAEAAERLIRYYGGDAIAADTDLTAAGKHLDGQIPATIAEAVKRAKLVQLRLQEPGTKITQLTSDAITEAANTMSEQNRILAEASKPKNAPVTIDQLIQTAVTRGTDGLPDEVSDSVY